MKIDSPSACSPPAPALLQDPAILEILPSRGLARYALITMDTNAPNKLFVICISCERAAAYSFVTDLVATFEGTTLNPVTIVICAACEVRAPRAHQMAEPRTRVNALISMTANAIKHWPAHKKLMEIHEMDLVFHTTDLAYTVIPMSMVKGQLTSAFGMMPINLNTDTPVDSWMTSGCIPTSCILW